MYIPHFTWCRGKMKVKPTKWIPFPLYVHLMSTWHSSQDGCSQPAHPPPRLPLHPPKCFQAFPIFFFCSSTSVNYTKLKPKNKGGNEASDSHICTWVQTTMSFCMQRHHKAEHPDQWRVTVGMGKVTMLCPDWNQYSRVLHLWVSPHNLLEAFCIAKDGKPETLTYMYYLRA